MGLIRNLFSGRYLGPRGPVPLGDPKSATKYSANNIHRMYIKELYEEIDRRLRSRYEKGAILKGVTVNDIEIEAVRVEDRYKAIALRMIRKIESLLDVTLPYHDRAAIMISCAEIEFDRPLFRKERGRILLNEYSESVSEVGYYNWHAAAFFAATYEKQKHLVKTQDGYEVVEKRKKMPMAYAGTRCINDFVSSYILSSIPPIWTREYTMQATAKGVAWSSETRNNPSVYCEFPPGVTMEEMEKVFERARQDALDAEKSRKKLFDFTDETSGKSGEGKL